MAVVVVAMAVAKVAVVAVAVAAVAEATMAVAVVAVATMAIVVDHDSHPTSTFFIFAHLVNSEAMKSFLETGKNVVEKDARVAFKLSHCLLVELKIKKRTFLFDL